jgi:hypothetical protein
LNSLKLTFFAGCLAAALVLVAGGSWAGTSVSPGALEMDHELGVPAMPGDVADAIEDEVETPDADGKKRGELVIAPLPSRVPLVGWTLALPIMYIYKPEGTVEADHPWISGLGGFYTENDSYGGGLFHKMSIGGDVWRMKGALFVAEINYDYFGVGSLDDITVPLTQEMSLGSAEALREVFFEHFFLGLKMVYSKTDVSFNISPELLPPIFDPVELSADYTTIAIAPRLQYDTKDSDFYPTKGVFVDGAVELSSESLGSDNTFQKYKFELNHYLATGPSGVVASRLVTQYVSGDAPFFMYPAYGSNVDLRGYQTGTYRDRFLLAGQVEYRHRFTPRIGAVAFAGIGTVDAEFGRWGKSLPSAGGGFRYVLAKENNVSLRVDYAWGRDDEQFYVGIGESF